MALTGLLNPAIRDLVARFWRDRVPGLPVRPEPVAVGTALRAQDWDLAAALLSQRLTDRKIGPHMVLQRIQLSAARGHLEELSQVYADLGRAVALPAPVLEQYLRRAEEFCPPNDILAICDHYLPSFPDLPALFAARIVALAQLGDEPAFLSAIEAALDQLPTAPEFRHPLPLGGVRDKARRDRIVARLHEKWPTSRLLRATGLLIARDRRMIEGGVEFLDRHEMLSQAALQRLAGDRSLDDRLAAELDPLDPAAHRNILMMRRALDRIEPARDLRRPLITFEGGGDVFVSPRGDSGVTVLAFCGLRNELMVPAQLFDAELARRGFTGIYVNDRRLAAFMAGIDSLGDDWTQTAEALRRLVDDAGTDRLLVVGSSAGGGGAVTAGADLRAEAVLIHSGILTGDLAVRKAIGDSRAPMVAWRAWQARGARCHMPNVVRDSTWRPRTHLYFGEDMAEDVANAALFDDFEHVRRHRLPGPCGHGSAWRLLHDGQLGASIDRALAA